MVPIYICYVVQPHLAGAAMDKNSCPIFRQLVLFCCDKNRHKISSL